MRLSSKIRPKTTRALRYNLFDSCCGICKLFSSLKCFSKYENDILELFKSYNLWLEPPTNINTQDNNSNSNIKEESDFHNLLSDMEKNCQRVLNEANEMSTLMSDARQVQEKLYNTYQKARLVPSVGTSNPKESLKTLQHM